MGFSKNYIAFIRTKSLNSSWLMSARKNLIANIAFVSETIFAYLLRGSRFFYNTFAFDTLARRGLKIGNPLGTKKVGMFFPELVIGNRMAWLTKSGQIATYVGLPESSKNSMGNDVMAINSNPRCAAVLASMVVFCANFPGNLCPVFSPISQIPFHFSIIAWSGGLCT